ncbi:MAG: Holliday junction branch migration protein RuvA [Candidatus Paceibacterota bacterium]|jgi:Holliday junction DNA helicase RuvA
MIASLHGKVIHIDTRFVVLEVNGIGYKVFLTADSIHGMKMGDEKTFSTYLAVREDALDLFGFISKKEKDFFELLISISGIGPKGALNILSAVSSDTLINAIRTGSTAHLVKVSGIGRKTAEKIVLELKDKLGVIDGEAGAEFAAGLSSDMDAIEALKALGYDADDAREAMKKVSPEITDTSAKIKAALKMLG